MANSTMEFGTVEFGSSSKSFPEKAAEDIFKPTGTIGKTIDNFKVSQLQGTATVIHPTGIVDQTVENLSLTLNEGATPYAEVTAEMGFTLNLGNFQSAKMMVSLKAPSNIDPESLDKTFEYIKKWVDKKLSGMVQEAKAELE